jgi:hypothetical protein
MSGLPLNETIHQNVKSKESSQSLEYKTIIFHSEESTNLNCGEGFDGSI